MTKFNIDLTTSENLFLVKAVFEAKKVPLSILSGIEQYKERHRAGFPAVRASVKPGIRVEEDFDFYFNYLVQKVAELHSLWEI
jgi:hypothetical protein